MWLIALALYLTGAALILLAPRFSAQVRFLMEYSGFALVLIGVAANIYYGFEVGIG